MRMEATIEVTGLRKRFGPAVTLDGISFTVLPGRVTGLAGPKGRGKSTTMRVILGLDAADAAARWSADGATGVCGTRSATSGRCWTRPRCSTAEPPGTTCCGGPAMTSHHRITAKGELR
jgi:ABC-type glutathione transport system ATPase component